MKFEQIGTTSFKVKHVSIYRYWKNLGKFQQAKSTLVEQEWLQLNSGQVEHLYLISGNFKLLYSF